MQVKESLSSVMTAATNPFGAGPSTEMAAAEALNAVVYAEQLSLMAAMGLSSTANNVRALMAKVSAPSLENTCPMNVKKRI
jgi:hypothetical protein